MNIPNFKVKQQFRALKLNPGTLCPPSGIYKDPDPGSNRVNICDMGGPKDPRPNRYINKFFWTYIPIWTLSRKCLKTSVPQHYK